MSDEPEVSRDTSAFGDFRIRLGIFCAIMLFCMGVIIYSILFPGDKLDKHVDEAWNILLIGTVAMLGFAVWSDKVRKP